MFLNAEVLVCEENGEIKSMNLNSQLSFFKTYRQMIEILFKTGKEFRVLHEPLNVETLKEALVLHKPKVLFIYCHGDKQDRNNPNPHLVPTTFLSV